MGFFQRNETFGSGKLCPGFLRWCLWMGSGRYLCPLRFYATLSVKEIGATAFISFSTEGKKNQDLEIRGLWGPVQC